MAGKGIEIDIAANAREFQRGTKDVEAALEDVAGALDDATRDAQRAGDQMSDGLADGARDGARKADRSLDDISDTLKDVARDADRAGRELGDEISDGAKDAERSTEKLERSFKDVADASKRGTKDAGDSLKRNVKDGADGASEAVGEFKDEAISNLSETVSSFRGDAEDIAQIAQDTLGGVVGNLGPVGMAAGAAGAVGIGLIIAELQKAKEAEQEFREQVGELVDVFIETGGEGAEHVEAIASRLRELAAPAEEGAMGLAEIKRQAEAAGIPVDELARAYAGAGGDLRKYIDQMDEGLEKTQGLGVTVTRENMRQREGYKAAREALVGLTEQQEEAAEATRIWAEEGGLAEAARAEAMSTLQSELDKAVGSWNDYIDAETNATDPAGYIAAMQARMDATANFNSNVQTLAAEFGLSHDEVQAILDQGVDFAPMLQSILDSGMGEQYAEQIRLMLDGGQSIVDGTPIDANITAQADTDTARGALDETATDRESTVTARPETRTAARDLDAVADKKRTATITAKANTTLAASALRSLERRRSATITAVASTWAADQALERLARPRTATITAEVRDREGRRIP